MIPVTHKQALKTLANGPYIKSPNYIDQQWRAIREGANPKILVFEKRFIKLAKEYNIPLWTHTLVRTVEEQKRLKATGFSKAGAGYSPHNYGMAVDIVHGTEAWNLNEQEWAVLGQIGKEAARKCNVKVQWGGEWDFWDPAHWELKGWADFESETEQARALEATQKLHGKSSLISVLCVLRNAYRKPAQNSKPRSISTSSSYPEFSTFTIFIFFPSAS